MRAPIWETLYYVTLIALGTLSFVLPDDRDLVQGIAYGATGSLLLVALLEHLQRRRRVRDDHGAGAPRRTR